MTELLDEARSAADRVVSAAERALRDARLYLASPQGKNLRTNVARGLMAAAPIVAGTPLMRRSLVGRVLGLAGAAAAVVKVAEAIRDWEPAERPA
ncbi:MAG: hypothetical protein WAT66_08065 [Actinomycetota bacterium]